MERRVKISWTGNQVHMLERSLPKTENHASVKKLCLYSALETHSVLVCFH